MKNFYVFRDFDAKLLEEVGSPLLDWVTGSDRQRGDRANIWINSDGGEMPVLQTFLDAVNIATSRGLTIATCVTGFAGSAASMLAVAGTKGYRYMGVDATHLVHWGQSQVSGADPTALWRDYVRGKDHFEFVQRHYKIHTSIPNFEREMASDNFFVSLEEAFDYGMADHETRNV